MFFKLEIPEETLNQLRDEMRRIAREELQALQEKELEDKLYSPKEACQLFRPRISKVTLHNWTKEGYLKKHQIGGRVFYKYDEIMEAVQLIKRNQPKAKKDDAIKRGTSTI